jgi:nitrite reductase/ring-hydroxylating ferredoxin subunit
VVTVRVRAVVDRIERLEALDRVGNGLQKAVHAVLRGRVRDVLHGTWLGHPLHAAAVLLPIGSWVSSAALDLLRVNGRGATVLSGLGSAAAVPAVVAGLNDWASLTREQRRVGLVHAGANATATALHVASLAARQRGDLARARLLGYAGVATVGFGAFLGGHLAYRQAAAVNQAEPFLRQIREGWHGVCDLQALTPGKPQVYRIDDVPVMVVRHGADDVTVMIEHCGHNTGPLGEGEVQHLDGTDCVVCPWHGSAFRLTDGTVVHGPAATTQPQLRTRVVNGWVEASVP